MELHRQMRLAGVLSVDDLAMVSEKELYLSANISAETIKTIYAYGKEIINTIHEQHKVEIQDLECIRAERKRCETRGIQGEFRLIKNEISEPGPIL